MEREKHTLRSFVPISRRIFRHPFWDEKRTFSRFEAWIYLIKEARFEDSRVYDGNKPVEVGRGQLYVSIRFLAQAFGWTRKKTTNFIDLLIVDRMIRKEIHEDTGQMIVTICNYDFYNSSGDTKETARGQCGDSMETKSNKEKKDKKEKNENISPHEERWRDDYSIYLSEMKNALQALSADKDFIAQRERYRPQIDIVKTLEKACGDYWSRPDVWEQRRTIMHRSLDWRRVLTNALDLRQNWVWKLQSNDAKRRLDEAMPKDYSQMM